MPKLYIEIDAPQYDDHYLSYIDAVVFLNYYNEPYEIFTFDLEDDFEVKEGKEFLKSLGFQKTEEFDWDEEVIEITNSLAKDLIDKYKKELYD